MWACCAPKKYAPKDEPPIATPYMEFVHIGEPHVGELELYVKNRREHVHIYTTTAEVRNKMLRNITDNAQLIDQYPKGEWHGPQGCPPGFRWPRGRGEHRQESKGLQTSGTVLDGQFNAFEVNSAAGRQYLQDEDYLLILRDLLNLSNILDDMEQTGTRIKHNSLWPAAPRL